MAALKEVPADVIADAAGLLVRDATLHAMPTPAAWLAACEDVAEARIEKQKQLPPSPDECCSRCHDTGFAWFHKDGTPLPAPPVGSHGDYVVRACACRSTNPKWTRKHAPPKVPKYTSKRKPKREERWFDRD